MEKENMNTIKELYPREIIFRITKEDWDDFKKITNKKGQNAHGLLRTWIKNYIKKNE